MDKRRLKTEQIGEYNGLEVWTSNEDYWVDKEDIATHSFGSGSGKSRIFIRKEAYDLIQTSPISRELMQTLYDHEYSEFLAMHSKGENPHKNGRSLNEQKLDAFLKDNGYFNRN